MLIIEKVRKVKTPHRGTRESAGVDFFIPEFDHQECRDLNKDIVSASEVLMECKIIIAPGGSKLIPSGIKVSFAPGKALVAFNKSGVAVKMGLTIGACVVDSDYQGEIFIHLINTTQKFVQLDLGQKIVQFVLMPISLCLVSEGKNIHPQVSERGEGRMGSTGNE